jgi:hypothetical protein
MNGNVFGRGCGIGHSVARAICAEFWGSAFARASTDKTGREVAQEDLLGKSARQIRAEGTRTGTCGALSAGAKITSGFAAARSVNPVSERAGHQKR